MSSRRRTRRDYKTLIAAFERSGLSLNAFARKKGVPYSTLALWKNRLAKEAKLELAVSTPQFLPVTVEGAGAGLPLSSPPENCEVRLRSGHELRIPPGFDPVTLCALVNALEPSSCSR